MPRFALCSIQSVVASAIVHFAQLVGHARVKQNTFGGRGLASVNVGRDTDIAVAPMGVLRAMVDPDGSF